MPSITHKQSRCGCFKFFAQPPSRGRMSVFSNSPIDIFLERRLFRRIISMGREGEDLTLFSSNLRTTARMAASLFEFTEGNL